MITLDPQTLRHLQLVELEMLDEVDRICRKNGIRYCIIAGTMLGAVRHGGFIPWDDDVDVALLRPDYERFREACARDLDESRFLFQDHQVTPGYRWGYGKLRRRDSLFLREYQEHMPYHQGVFLDVFPLDTVPESRLGRAWENLHCFCVRKLLWAPVGKVAHPSTFWRTWYSLLDRIPEARVKSMLDRRIDRARTRDGSWVRILMFPTPNREYGYKREWYETTDPCMFEGKEYPGVHDAPAYLRFKFGDYMTLPPERERKTHPVSAIELPPLASETAVDA